MVNILFLILSKHFVKCRRKYVFRLSDRFGIDKDYDFIPG